MNLTDTTILVTGGSSGLGAACVHHLVAKGARALIADVNEQAGRQLADQLGDAVQFAHTDVTDAASVSAAVDQAVAWGGSLQGAVNCAGILGASRVLTREGPHDLDLFSKVIQVNLIGTFNVARLAAAAMVEAPEQADGERGVIIQTASVAAFDGQIGQVAYAASKGGVAGMTLPMARELGKFGIRVVTIAPGVFSTPMMQAAPDAVREALESHAIFPRRLGLADEYGLFASQIFENPMLNGSVLRLDGAIRMPPK